MVSSLTQSQENLSQHDSEKLVRIRHTCAHIMAMAVQKLFPGTKPGFLTHSLGRGGRGVWGVWGVWGVRLLPHPPTLPTPPTPPTPLGFLTCEKSR